MGRRAFERQLSGKVALITGGASGIGLALGRQLLTYGAEVILADCDEKRLDTCLEGASSLPREPIRAVLDVTDVDAFDDLVERTFAGQGRLDFLFNNAGIGITGEVRDMSREAWRRILAVNLHGVVHGVEAVYPRMIRQGFGHIANTACVAGLVPFPMSAAYCGTKHAIVGLSTALRSEAAQLGIGISVICPGTVATEMFDRIEYLKVDKRALLDRIRPAWVSAETCARKILAGVLANRAVITVNLHARLAWWVYRMMPRAYLAALDHFFGRMSRGLRVD